MFLLQRSPLTQTFHAFGAAVVLAAFALPASADEVGYQDLLNRLGASAPTGAGVPVVQVEAGGLAAYGPDQTLAEFSGKTFTLMSGATASAWHPTTVGLSYYGNVTSMAKGVTNISVFEVNHWLQAGYLHYGQGTTVLPGTPPSNARVFNHSWIGSFGSNASDNECLRRSDYAMNRDFTLMIEGENNGAGSAMSPLLSMTYNGLSVGLTTGAHSAGPVPAGIDGAGRQKPEIVAPGQFTSFSAPVVGAAAALLYETANTPPLVNEGWARRGLVIKSVLLAGAKHRETWTNNAPQTGADRGIATHPLDTLYGVDTVNIDRSHMILTGGRTPALSVLKLASFGGLAGWSQFTWPLNSVNTPVYIRFTLLTTNNTAAFVCNWARAPGAGQLPGGAAAPSMANLDMTLYRVVNETPVPITGPDGANVFSSGNCASRSTVDNVEHLYLRGLEYGDYVLEVKRMDTQLVTAPACISWIIDPGPLFGDINGDHAVDGGDLGLLMGSWSLPGPTDLNHDGTTDGFDLGALMGVWTN